MTDIPRINLWLLAMVIWLAAYVLLGTQALGGWSSWLAGVALLLGLLCVRVGHSDLNPRAVARGVSKSRLLLVPWLIALGVLTFTAGWLSWVPGPSAASLESWRTELEWLESDEVGENFDPKKVPLKASRSTANGGINALWRESGPGPIPRRLNLNLSNELAGFLECENGPEAYWLAQGRAYLTHFSLANFDGRQWKPESGQRLRLPSNDQGWAWIDQELSPEERAVAIGYQLRVEVAPGQALPSLQHPLAVRDESVILTPSGLVVSGVPLADGATMQLDFEGLSQPQVWKDLRQQRLLEVGAPGEEYLKPASGELGQVIKDIVAEEFEGLDDPRQKLEALAKWMASRFEYSLQTSNRDNLDPVVNFLRHEPRGHCELFATAGALMAREMGIPSRVAYGHAKGQFLEISNLFAFRDRDAHAWTEVYFKGYGWTVFDLTPSMGEAPPEVSEPVTETEMASQFSGAPGDPPSELAAMDPWQPSSHEAAWLGAGVLMVLLALSWQSFSGRRRSAGAQGGPTEPDYVARLRNLAILHGIPSPAALPLRELVARLEQAGVRWKEAEELIQYHYRHRYQNAEPCARTETKLLATLPSLRSFPRARF